MSNNDPLANVLSHILNYERVGNKAVVTTNNSRVIKGVLQIMQDGGYIGGYEETEDSKGNILTINLIGAINKCGVIKPRFSFTFEDIEKMEKKYLPSKGFGIIIVSTSRGIMTIEDAKKNKLGGRLVAYCY